jgi:hypothetical protein
LTKIALADLEWAIAVHVWNSTNTQTSRTLHCQHTWRTGMGETCSTVWEWDSFSANVTQINELKTNKLSLHRQIYDSSIPSNRVRVDAASVMRYQWLPSLARREGTQGRKSTSTSSVTSSTIDPSVGPTLHQSAMIDWACVRHVLN